MATKEQYESPVLVEIGDMVQLTKEYGWGIQELIASIVSGGPISIGKCKGSCFS